MQCLEWTAIALAGMLVATSGLAGCASDSQPGADFGTGPDGAACGDPGQAAMYSTCLAAMDQMACQAAGGTWGRIGLAPFEECGCPTGQSDCPCTSSADCMSTCIAGFTGGRMFDCSGVTAGTCSQVSITVGCWCYFDDIGRITALCID